MPRGLINPSSKYIPWCEGMGDELVTISGNVMATLNQDQPAINSPVPQALVRLLVEPIKSYYSPRGGGGVSKVGQLTHHF